MGIYNGAGGGDEPAWSRALSPSLAGGEEEVVMRNGWGWGMYIYEATHTHGGARVLFRRYPRLLAS